MGCEVDFLAVDRGKKGGDAIALRYGNLRGGRAEQTVIVIDGGYTSDGDRLVQHVRTHYGTDRVDLVVSTHPDEDHVAGLIPVIEQLEVARLWMHRPWVHSRPIAKAREAGFPVVALGSYVTASLGQASELEKAAAQRGVPITEPFTGLQTDDGRLVVVGPTFEYYEQLAARFPRPETAHAARDVFTKSSADPVGTVHESMSHETITDGGSTTPQNNSSVLCLLEVDARSLLFTGDAGIPALTAGVQRLRQLGIKAGALQVVQVPHHGSRANVGPTVLDELLGSAAEQGVTRGRAYVSAPKLGAPHFPSKAVTNAFLRRGYPVIATAGSAVRHKHEAPGRGGWVRIDPLPLFEQVEDWG